MKHRSGAEAMQANVLQPDLRKDERTLIDELIDEQRSLTAVDRFSQKHDRHEVPTQAKYYRDLIPLAAPQPGEQYAFEVNLDQCSGCKACVTACHSLNGLDDGETWRDIGLLHGGTRNLPVQQTVTTACHHCVDPACLNGCPVLAYDKDPATGIVRHLDDQCIGCQYCVLTCPYEVPKYSAKRGIVRKCDMCSNRLTAGEAPACVQACPNEAIRITIVKQEEVVTRHRSATGNNFLPSSPDPSYTVPTTCYVSERALPGNLQSADEHEVKPQPAHSPLVFMLVLTQLSVGVFTLDFILGLFLSTTVTQTLRPLLSMAGLLTGLAGIAVSVAHLGRPLGAWRAFLGLRRSWLSREIVVFGLYIALAIAYATTVRLGILPQLQKFLLGGTVLSGLTGVFCSVMIYHDTQREFWAWPRSARKFFGSTLLLGLAAAYFVTVFVDVMTPGTTGYVVSLGWLAGVLALVTLAKLGHEGSILRELADVAELSSLQRTALLMEGPLRAVFGVRAGCGVVGGMILPWVAVLEAVNQPAALLGLASISLLLVLAGELLERYLFFIAVSPRKMPGGVAS